MDVIDAVGGRNGALQGGRDEPAHEFGIRADVDGRDGDDRVLAAGILTNVERTERLQASDDDHEADHHRENGAADEKVGEFHSDGVVIRQLSSGSGLSLNSGVTALSTTTDWPLRSLKTPVLTTVSPSSRPETTAT